MTVGRNAAYAAQEEVTVGARAGVRRDFWLRLTEPAPSVSGDLERRKARLLSALLIALSALVLLATVITIPVLADPGFVASRDAYFVGGIGVSLALLAAYGLSRTSHFVLATWLAIAVFYVAILAGVLAGPDYISANVLLAYLVVVVLLGSMFLSMTSTVLLAVVSLLSVVLLPVVDSEFTVESLLPALSVIVIPAALLVVSAAIRERDLLQISRRNRQLRATVEVGQAMAAARASGALLAGTVEFIARTFDFYHVQIFLVDELQIRAELQASTGETGRQLLERGHHLPVGSASVIGQVVARNQPVSVSGVRVDTTIQRNELLPETQSEIALPMRAGEKVLGVLDVQSAEANAFSEDDIDTLQIMANQVAVAIENAGLFDEVQDRAMENERLLDEAKASLQQIEALNRRLTGEGWQEYLRTHARSDTVGYTMQGGQATEDVSWTANMRRAFGEQRLIVGDENGESEPMTISLPLRVRGEVIGVVEVARDSTSQWMDDDLKMAESLIDRLSVALDNARLVEQAETLAQRELLVNEITQTIQGADSVDDILQTALMELGQVLGASRGMVQLKAKGNEQSSVPQDSASETATDEPSTGAEN